MQSITSKFAYTGLLIAIITASACSSSPQDSNKAISTQIEQTQKSTKSVDCPEQRPQLCTMIYSPVCATNKDGSSFTAPSDCSACSQENVLSYTEGSCINNE